MSKGYKHLSREERYSIKEMRDIGLSINYISKKMGSSAFLMGKFMQSSRIPLNPSKVFEKVTHF